MTNKPKPKRDQRAYEMYHRYSAGMLAVMMLAAVERLGDPYTLLPCVSGVKGYPPKVMAVVVALNEYWNCGYRRTSANIRSNGDLLRKLGLDNAPSKSAIGTACKRVPKQYLHDLNDIVVADIRPKSVAGDSTALSTSGRVWVDVRTGGAKAKRGWTKLHTLVDIETRVILKMEVTKGTAADCPPMMQILEGFEGGDGDGCFDSAYLSRKLCNLLRDLGLEPFIKPKSNTTSNSKGSWAWKGMVTMYMEDRDGFDDRYHQRSVVEAVYAALKAMFGNSLRTRIPPTQTTEIMMHVLNYNVDLVTRAKIKAGSLTEPDIRAMVA